MAKFSHLKDVENDGKSLVNAKEPPEQSSVYIPPGKNILRWFDFIQVAKLELLNETIDFCPCLKSSVYTTQN